MDIPEMMLLAEAVLIGLDNVTDGLVVYPARIRSRFLDQLPFMVTEAVSDSQQTRSLRTFAENPVDYHEACGQGRFQTTVSRDAAMSMISMLNKVGHMRRSEFSRARLLAS